jgi:hypothetical protein
MGALLQILVLVIAAFLLTACAAVDAPVRTAKVQPMNDEVSCMADCLDDGSESCDACAANCLEGGASARLAAGE